MADGLTAEQLEACARFAAAVSQPVTQSVAERFLAARNFDVPRATELFEQHEATRKREGCERLDPSTEPLRSELATGKFSVLPGRDPRGAAVAVFTASAHSPAACTHRTTLQGVLYQLDAALASRQTQRSGLVFVYDMAGSSYANFDLELSQKILLLLKGAYPAKLKRLLIVAAPLWFKAPFRLLRLFVREKLRARVALVSPAQLAQLVGAPLAPDHAAWLATCLNGVVALPPPAHPSPSPSPSPNDEPGLDGDGCAPPPPAPAGAGPGAGGGGGGAGGAESASSSASSSGFSDDEALDEGAGLTLEQWGAQLAAQGRAGLAREYAEIRARPPDGAFVAARLKHNLPKNRYTDVLCLDHSRVVLSSEGDSEDPGDYINANFVDGFKQRNAYISTQGPLPATAHDFWRMVWEQQVRVVVMTTRCVERGRNKCAQYWAEGEGEAVTFGAFHVATCNVQRLPDYTVSQLQLTCDKCPGQSRPVDHCQFTSWPDYGVPSDAAAILEFVHDVRGRQAAGAGPGAARGPPMLVHCSAGIGRTGTFITLDACMRRLDEAAVVDVRGCVERVRAQRAYSIQMPDQYVFCHRALAQHALDRLPSLAPAITALDLEDD